MALVVNDRVKETSTTTGTGTLSLAGAVVGFETFVAGIGNSNTTFYSIVNEDGAFEVGIGTVTDAGTDTLSRDTILSSSNSDSAVDFAAGTKDVFCTLPASRFVPGKIGGTNFTNCLLVGHATTGTLNNANDNTGVGNAALDNLAAGDFNTALGSEAVSSVSSTRYNTGLGYRALKNTSGESNTAAGANSLLGTYAGNFNTAIGRNALTANNTGDNNVSLGYDSGAAITGDTANYNLTLGTEAGDNITSGAGNVIIGSVDAGSATGDRQLKIAGYDGSTTTTWISGDNSGKLTMTDGEIIPGKIGGTNFTNSLLIGHATTGTLDGDASNNIGIGDDPLSSLTNGISNVIVGNSAGDAITSARYTVAVGTSAGGSINTGGKNTLLGFRAGTSIQGGQNNVSLGADSGTSVSSGQNNILLGFEAGDNISSGDGNVIIGSINADSATGDKQLKIADGVDGSVNWISGTNAGAITFNSAYTFPTADGSAGKVLTTDGSGTLTFETPTTGDITSVVAGSGLTGGATSGAATLNVGAGNLIDVQADQIDVDLSELTTSTSDGDGDFFVVVDASNAQKKLTKGNINNSGFNNDAGYTTNTGDITSVVAGSGLTGGATSGAATLNVGAGTGIDVAADAISVDVSDFMTNGSNNRVVTATGADGMNAEANMQFDGSTLTVTGDIVPGANDSHDLGASDNVWRNLYTGDLHLSNESKSEGNAVDGTKGSWTIQEGAQDLYLFNNKSGKKYKFKLEEV